MITRGVNQSVTSMQASVRGGGLLMLRSHDLLHADLTLPVSPFVKPGFPLPGRTIPAFLFCQALPCGM